jgi:hypothetical protein
VELSLVGSSQDIDNQIRIQGCDTSVSVAVKEDVAREER